MSSHPGDILLTSLETELQCSHVLFWASILAQPPCKSLYSLTNSFQALDNADSFYPNFSLTPYPPSHPNLMQDKQQISLFGLFPYFFLWYSILTCAPHMGQCLAPWGCRQEGSCMAWMIPLLTHFLSTFLNWMSLKCFGWQSQFSATPPAPAQRIARECKDRFCNIASFLAVSTQWLCLASSLSYLEPSRWVWMQCPGK